MDSEVNIFFEQVLAEKENSELLNEALQIAQLREEVIKNLTRFVAEDEGHFWWQDKELMGIFEELYKGGCITLPKNPVDRLRWTALLCIEISKMEGFSWGNVIIRPDYLPDEMVEIYERVYGTDVIEEVFKIREQLREKGWEATFPK